MCACEVIIAWYHVQSMRWGCTSPGKHYQHRLHACTPQLMVAMSSKASIDANLGMGRMLVAIFGVRSAICSKVSNKGPGEPCKRLSATQ